MKLTTLVRDIQKCAADLLEYAHTPEAGQLVAVCAGGLAALAREAEAYEKNLLSSRPLLDSFAANLHDLKTILGTRKRNESSVRPAEIYDRAFALLEELAVFMREKLLRAGDQSDMQAEHAVLEYYECSGLWPVEERTVVNDYYYIKLPLAVMSALPKAFWGR